MNTNTLIPLLVTSIITIASWGILNFFSKRRDEMNKRKDIRINYLIQAWRLLEAASNRDDNTLNHNLEIAIADIQLFGTKRQIELAQQFAEEIAQSRTSSSLDLLISLREDLRKELLLETVPNKFKFLRFTK